MGYKIFKTIKDNQEVKECSINTVITRRLCANRFYVFDSEEEFWKYYDAASVKDFCEIIQGDRPRKVYFDIESGKRIDMVNFLTQLRLVLKVTHPSIEPEIIVLDCCRPGKDSFHVIVNNVFLANNFESRCFAQQVKTQACVDYVDMAVYSRFQNYRTIGSVKSPEVQQVFHMSELGISCKKENTLIGLRRDIKIPLIYENYHLPATIPVESHDYPEEIEKFIPAGHEIRSFDGNMILLDRLAPTYCEICDRVHDNDNTAILQLVYCETHINVFEKCRRVANTIIPRGKIPLIKPCSDNSRKQCSDNSRKQCSDNSRKQCSDNSRKQCSDDNRKQCSDDSRKQCSDDNRKQCSDDSEEIAEPILERLIAGVPAHNDISDKNLHGAHIYCADHIEDFPKDFSTFILKAPMGMGKTTKLCEFFQTKSQANEVSHLQTKSQANEVSPRILFISFRRTFTTSLQAQIPDLVSYRDTETYEITNASAEKLIIQVESLDRLCADYESDIIILDESESIIEQFSANLRGEPERSSGWRRFVHLMQTAKKVICIDANISDRTFNVIRALRKAPIVFHWNQKKNQEDTTIFLTSKINTWYEQLKFLLNSGKRIVIPINVRKDAYVVQNFIERDFPKLRILIYTQKTPEKVRAADFANINHAWAQCDVLIYTPTVSAGLSFTEHHFDVLCGYFSRHSTNTEISQQMLSRVRNLGDKRMYIYVEAGRNLLFTTREHIFSIIRADNARLMKKNNINIQLLSIPTSLEEAGAHTIMQIENTRIKNLSQRNFLERFIMQFKERGFVLKTLRIATVSKWDIKSMRKEVTKSEAVEIAEGTTPWGHDQQEEFSRFYDYFEPLSAHIVEIAWKPNIRERFVNLNRALRVREQSCSEPNIVSNMTTHVHTEIPTIQDNVICELLQNMGFADGIFSEPQTITHIRSNIIANFALINCLIPTGQYRFDNDDVKYIDRILSCYYGLRMSVNDADIGTIDWSRMLAIFKIFNGRLILREFSKAPKESHGDQSCASQDSSFASLTLRHSVAPSRPVGDQSCANQDSLFAARSARTSPLRGFVAPSRPVGDPG